MTNSTYHILIRRKHRNGGKLCREDELALLEATHDEFVRRYNALYGPGLLDRRLAQLGCSIRNSFKPLFAIIAQQ